MTFHARLSSGALAVAIAAAAAVPAVAADPSPRPVPRACQEALAYEKTASSDTATPQAAYDAAIAGLEANKRCNDEPMRLTREAFLLSMRAGAEHALNVGDWRRDITRAQMLLANCANRPDVGRTTADNCRTQWRYNDSWMKRTLAQATAAPAAQPMARPSSTPAASSGTQPRPVIGPAQPPPAPPRPSPRP